jgi:hypothetical protein
LTNRPSLLPRKRARTREEGLLALTDIYTSGHETRFAIPAQRSGRNGARGE